MLERGSGHCVIVNFVMKLYGKYEFEVESGSSYFGVEDQGTYEFSFIRYDDCLGFEINQIIFFNIQYRVLWHINLTLKFQSENLQRPAYSFWLLKLNAIIVVVP